MSADQSSPARASEPEDPGHASRRLMRTALKGALGTLDRETGHPYASLVLLATEPGGAPIFLISRLALHTRNLEQDPRASILFDGTGGLGDPLTGGRLTVTGLARPSASATALRRFLARHPSAEGYAKFADFSVYELEVARGHYIGGFGRIVDLPPASLLADVADASALVEAEPDIVAHMNSDHADAIKLYATVLAGCPDGEWRMAGVDPDGTDLLHCTSAVRIPFSQRVRTAGEARGALVSLVQQARARQQERT